MRWALLLILLAACGSASQATLHPAQPRAVAAAVSPSPAPSLQPALAGTKPETIPEVFTGLPAGTYPVHLHSACSGRPNFHIAVLQSIAVSSAGQGVVSVPRGDVGRGLCLIVYSTPALATVLATKSI